MYINTIIDDINIKVFPELIIDYFRKNSEKKFNNLRSFYSVLLDYIGEDIKESYLNRILKYLSSTTPSLINIFEDFNSNIYDKELKSFVNNLVKLINKYDNNLSLYELMESKINLIFYNHEEYLNIKSAEKNKDFELLILLLLKHTFKTYQTNIPGITSTRLYEEAMTTEYDSERHKRMLKASADLDNVEASILYAQILLKKSPDKAIDYLLKAKSKPYILWKIGFEIEKNHLNNNSISKIEKEFSPLFIEDDFIKKISSDDINILLAVKIYYFTYKKYNFSKAINSIGKLLINNIIQYNNSKKETIEKAKYYLKMGIKLGNINAITNLSSYYIQHPEDNEYDEETIKKLLKPAAELGDVIANFFYGKLIYNQGNEEGIKYLIYSAELNHYKALFELGKIYESKNDYIKSIEYYKKAINKGYYDAAINLCKIYILLSTLYNKSIYIEYAKEILNDYLSKISDEKKEIAISLYNSLKQ